MTQKYDSLTTINRLNRESDLLSLLRHAFDLINEDDYDDKEFTQILHTMYISFMMEVSALLNAPVTRIERELKIDHDSAVKLFNQLRLHFIIEDPIGWLKKLILSTNQSAKKHAELKENELHGLDIPEMEPDTHERKKQKHSFELHDQ